MQSALFSKFVHNAIPL